MKKKNVALVAGGYGGEYEVSLRSAQNIAANLDPEKFDVYQIIISRNGWLYSDQGRVKDVDKNDFTIEIGSRKIQFDFAFITIHGTPGEDGKLQGYFDMIGLPYNTCNFTTAAITMNKAYTKEIVQSIEGLYVSPSVHLLGFSHASIQQILQNLTPPLFVKPNHGGSSVCTSKVYNMGEIEEALEKAFGADEQVLVEEFVQGREFSVGLYSENQKICVLPITEIIPANDFFDYEAKYARNQATEITPAELHAETVGDITRIVREVYSKLNCQGMVRIDFILQEGTQRFYFIEINTTPGQSTASLIPQQVSASGLALKDFYTGLIEERLSQRVAAPTIG